MITANESPLLISIVVTNFNYARFLRAALDSALAQTHPAVEVIAVDDGSTDDSREILASYGNAITAILKTNGGQASAYNAGFVASRGDAVIFLDADDVLDADLAARLARTIQKNPRSSQVLFCMEIINAHGVKTDARVPPSHLPDGDLRQPLRSFNNCIWWPPGSAHAYARRTLQRILPMPETDYKISADYYLTRCAALCGPVASLREPGGGYRHHGANSFYRTELDLAKERTDVSQIRNAHADIHRFAVANGLPAYPQTAEEMLDVRFAALRMTLLKLNPAARDPARDRLPQVLGAAMKSVVFQSRIPFWKRLAYLAWFAAMTIAPRTIAHLLAECFFHPSARRIFKKTAPPSSGQIALQAS